MSIVRVVSFVVQLVLVTPLLPFLGLMWFCYWIDRDREKLVSRSLVEAQSNPESADHTIAV